MYRKLAKLLILFIGTIVLSIAFILLVSDDEQSDNSPLQKAKTVTSVKKATKPFTEQSPSFTPHVNPNAASPSKTNKTSLNREKATSLIKETRAVEKGQKWAIDGFVNSRSGIDLSKVEIIVVRSSRLYEDLEIAKRGSEIPNTQFLSFPVQDFVTGYFSLSLNANPDLSYFVLAVSKDRQSFSKVHTFNFSNLAQGKKVGFDLNIESRDVFRGRIVDEFGVSVPDAIVIAASEFLGLSHLNTLQRLLYGFMSRKDVLHLIPIPPGGQAGAHVLTQSQLAQKDYVHPVPNVNQIPLPLVEFAISNVSGSFQLPAVLESSQSNRIHVFAKGYTMFSGTLPSHGDIVLQQRRSISVKIIDHNGDALDNIHVGINKKKHFGLMTFHNQGVHSTTLDLSELDEIPVIETAPTDEEIVFHPTCFPGMDSIYELTNREGVIQFRNLAIKEGWIQATSAKHGFALTKFSKKDRSLTIRLGGVGAIKFNYNIPQDSSEKIHFKAHPASMKNIRYHWKPGNPLVNTLPAGPLVLTYTIGSFSKTLKLNIKANASQTITISEYTDKQ
ncbi:MAG: hypothetical protein P1V97_25105 [Planctomycetota bacterium]|nr:hypothetical protein [Planctomycetota bacterium]